MALVSKSLQITGLDATPVTKLNTSYFGGSVRTAVGHIAAANIVGGTAGQWYTFVRVPARARVLGIFATGADTTTGDVACTLYRTAANGGAVIGAGLFSAGAGDVDWSAEKDRVRLDILPTALQRSQILSDAFATAIGTAGATADVEFDVALTIVTALGAGIATTLDVDYVLND